MARHINELKGALEFARFVSPDIRNALTNCLNHIASDMEEVEYEDSMQTASAFKELRNCITDYENTETSVVEVTPQEDDNGHEVDRDEVEVEYDVSDEIDRVIAAPNNNAEDDDDIED